MNRKDFQVDALFGMPGMANEAGCCKQDAHGKFVKPSTERTFQVWKRGCEHQELVTQRAMEQVIKEMKDLLAKKVPGVNQAQVNKIEEIFNYLRTVIGFKNLG